MGFMDRWLTAHSGYDPPSTIRTPDSPESSRFR